jgi:DNA-binding transcriptional LysR family regulator
LQKETPSSRAPVEDAFRDHLGTDRPRLELLAPCNCSPASAAAKEVASIGNQCTLLPRFAIERELEQGLLKAAAVREFADDPLVFFICLRSDRSLSPAAQAFADIVMDYCRRYRR